MNQLIEFTNLLHSHGRADAPEVQVYLKEHGAKDPAFRARAEAVLRGFSVRAMEHQPMPAVRR